MTHTIDPRDPRVGFNSDDCVTAYRLKVGM